MGKGSPKHREDPSRLAVDDTSFRTLVEQIPQHAVFMLDRRAHNVSWNEGVRRVFGYGEEEFIGQACAEIFTPEDRDKGVPAEEFRRAAKDGWASNDRWLMRKDGSRFWASGITSRIVDPQGNVIGFGKVVRDLTDEKRTMNALQQSEERLEIAFEAAGVSVWRAETDCDHFEIEHGLPTLLGASAHTTVRTLESFLAHVHREDRVSVREAFDRTGATGEDLSVELRIPKPSGAMTWLAMRGRRIVRGDEAPYLIGALLDISERKQSEARLIEAQRMDAVGHLAGGVAHELNNMLTAILGFTELLLEAASPLDPRRHDLEIVHGAATRAATITGQLLAFGRRQVLSPQVLDLNSALRRLEPMIRHVVGEDKRIETAYGADVRTVYIDPNQLEQAVLNLAFNARDALAPGGLVSLRTRTEAAPPELTVGRAPGHLPADCRLTGRGVVLTVQDSGSGMDATTRARAFEPFFTTKPIGKGTGLGLSTVLGIVQQSGGEVRLMSEPGNGTTFELVFPEIAPASSPEASVTRKADAPTIAIVEDEELVRRVTRRFLERAGYRCIEAANGAEALRLLERVREPVALVITDVIMPVMGGHELADEVQRRPDPPPFLFMTGYAEDDAIRKRLIDQDAPLLDKPFTSDQLLEKVRSVIDASDTGAN